MDWQEIAALAIVGGVGGYWAAVWLRGRASGRRPAFGCHGCGLGATSSRQSSITVRARLGEPAVIRLRSK